VINSVRTGYPSRYVYTSRFGSGQEQGAAFYIEGVQKYDLDTGEVQQHSYTTSSGGKGWAGEAVFAQSSSASQAEDSGFLLTYVFDVSTNTTELQILDAQHLVLVTRVVMPRRVPHGFHANWIGAEQIQP
jgi:carotenoid cleavage dioxygenase